MRIYDLINTLNFRIIITVVVTTLVVLSLAGILSRQSIQNDFRLLIETRYEECLNEEIDPRRCRRILPAPSQLQREFQSQVNISILTASLFALLISYGLSLLISKQVIKPLNNLKRSINDLDLKSYAERLEVEGPTEVQDLIIRYNELLEKLETTEKLREELVTDVVHELKTPLTKIKGRLEGIMDDIYPLDKPNLNKIRNNSDQLEYLVERLQEMIQIEAGKIKLHKQDIKLKELVGKIGDEYSTSKIKFRNKIPRKLTIRADKNRLMEILENLIENAYKYTKEGFIEVTADRYKIEVRDSGIGISEKELPFIFERFYRTEKSRNRKTGGMGVGLSIVKSLVENHGWEIEVESEEGKGTKFTIHLSQNAKHKI